MKQIHASFRDPSGNVFTDDDRILRTVNEYGKENYEFIKSTDAIHKLIDNGKIVRTKELSRSESLNISPSSAYLLEHERIPFISHPYEWSFSALKDAALLHLDLQIELLGHGIAFSDASAYNIQFIGAKPILIDFLSLKRYEENEPWVGYRQFCEQFLNPLYLRSQLEIPYWNWYRGSIKGIETKHLSKLLPFKSLFSLKSNIHIRLQAYMEEKYLSQKNKLPVNNEAIKYTLSKKKYIALLEDLRRWVNSLSINVSRKDTIWGNYENTITYNSDEHKIKHQIIAEFVSRLSPDTLVDLGCNAGEYSQLALTSGAKHVVGFDFDEGALELAYSRSKKNDLNFLPLYFDAMNPSPNQGWRQEERIGFKERTSSNAVLALAFEHHLAITHNVPLEQVIDFVIGVAPSGIIEFVPKDDPTVKIMLSARKDIFDNYNLQTFKNILSSKIRIVEQCQISNNGRTLFIFEQAGV